MSFYPGLTHEKAVERIGELLPYSVAYAPWTLDPGVLLQCDGKLYDATWTISEDSNLVRALKELREAQRQFGFAATQAREANVEAYYANRRTGIYGFASGHASQLQHYYIISDDHLMDGYQAAKEAIRNAIEHGSDYCLRGHVTVRFRGGTHAGLFEVTDPGNGNVRIPLSVEEILAIHEKSNRRFLSKPRNYSELMRAKRDPDNWSEINLSRGYGVICFTLSKASVNMEAHEGGYTVRVLYDPEVIPEWHSKYV